MINTSSSSQLVTKVRVIDPLLMLRIVHKGTTVIILQV